MDLDIWLEDGLDGRGRYVARLDGQEAQLTFRRLGGGAVLVEHTGVPDAHRGKGVAMALVERLVADSRALGLKIVPRCSFVVAAFERHPEWAGLRADRL